MDGGAVRPDDGSRLTPSGSEGDGSPEGVPKGAPVVFFDGHCRLCNTFVDFVVARDRRARFRFASLQGTTAARLIPDDAVSAVSLNSGDLAPESLSASPSGLPLETSSAAPRSVVLLESGIVYRRSEAALRVLAGLGGLWRLVNVLCVVPRPVRDFIYDYIARRRYRWFGRRAACRMPGPGERGRFLP